MVRGGGGFMCVCYFDDLTVSWQSLKVFGLLAPFIMA